MTRERALIEQIKEKKRYTTLPYGVDKDKLLSLAREYASETVLATIEKICS